MEAEAVGGILAMWLIHGVQEVKRDPTSIYTDSQAFLQVLEKKWPKSGAHLIEKLHTIAEEAASGFTLIGNTPRFIFRWVAGHANIPGNEVADHQAKLTACEGSSPTEELPPSLRRQVPASVEAIKSQYLQKLRKEWKNLWNTSPRKGKLEAVDDSFPFDRHRKISSSLTRAQASLLVQL